MQNDPTHPRVLTREEARAEAALDLQQFCGESVTLLSDLHDTIQRGVASATEGYWQAGQRLHELKKRLVGKFDDFLANNRERLRFGRSTAYVYLRFYVQHAGRVPDTSLRSFIIADRTPRGSHAGDVALKPSRTGWAGVVNRFELVWQRWEDDGEDEQDEAREVTRPMYERLKRLHEG